MKLKYIALAAVLGLLAWNLNVVAGEHPEHPTSHGEQPGKKPSAADESKFRDDYEQVVKDYVADQAKKSGGAFTIKDDVLNKQWKLELVKVHKNKICMLDMAKTCFACADFKEVGGKNKLDLDLYADHAADGSMTVNKVLIHKVNGKPRFTYDKDNKMVPLK